MRLRVLGRSRLGGAILLLLHAAFAATASAEAALADADPYPSTYQPTPSAPVVLIHATILDGAGARIDDGDLAIARGKVLAVGHDLPRPADATIIDARGRWVTPGLIDVHTHLGTYTLPQTSQDAEAGDVTELHSADAADTWIEHAVRSVDPAFSRALAGGVTTLQILPGSSVLIGGRSVIVHPIPSPTVAGMKVPGAPQGLKMACGGNPKGFLASHGGPTSRQGEIARFREELIEAQAYKDRWDHFMADDHGPPPGAHGPGRGPGSRGPGPGRGGRPPERELKEETLVALLDGRLPLHIHCYRSDDMARMIDLSHEFGFRIAAFHHAAEAYKIAPLLAKEGICVAGWPDWWGFKREAEDEIRENVAFVDATGVCAMMHSDIPVLGDHLALEAAKAAAAGRRFGLPEPPERIIRWVTSNPARAIGLGDRIGRLAPGYDADLVLWSGDPFSVYSKPDQVYIDGALAFDRAAPPRPSDFELGRSIDGVAQ